jgi:hypothetical protein
MPDENFQYALIDISQGATSAFDEDSKVSCGPDISNNARMCVTIFIECVCEGIDMWSAESRPQTPERLRRFKMSFEQRMFSCL